MLVLRWIRLTGLIPAMGIWLVPLLAQGRDLVGRYANSPLKEWFGRLKSHGGLCCSNADGYVAKSGHYRVRVPQSPASKIMVWIDVPSSSVVTEPNKLGRTMVWPEYYEGFTGDERDPQIGMRCFMPGSMT